MLALAWVKKQGKHRKNHVIILMRIILVYIYRHETILSHPGAPAPFRGLGHFFSVRSGPGRHGG
jgi:hypothetical protein